ncbi:MAG: radical SAM protein, partial [Clostridia bacterium]
MGPLALLVLRITQRCNLACRYCYAAGERETAEEDMTAEMAIRAVEEACPPGGTLKIQFTGGEPLLNLPVMEAVWQYGQRSGRHLRLAVQTNGTLLTPQTLRALERMGCALGVSLDGNGDANGLRVFPDGKPAFSSIIEGIREVARAGMRCNLTAVVSDVSAPHLGGLLELALWLGCRGDWFRPLSPHGPRGDTG